MPRPKGSKNKSTLEREAAMEQPREFNYEEDDAKFDASYNVTSIQGAGATFTFDNPPSNASDFMTAAQTTKIHSDQNNQLFLVEGEVQLSSREPGRGAMVAKQTRLVSANSDDQAIQKFVKYFAGLSDAQSVYTVINAAAMETIQ